MSRTAELVQGVLAGDRKSIARAISIVEDNRADASAIISELFSSTGKAHIIGITGPGGAGKSTLIEKIVREYRQKNKTVAVVAVDPTSPFTGGAFLGDRIRMQELSTDPGVFIRSMASRNYLGGLARATKDAVTVLDAAGKDVIVVETVGAGQSEVEVVKVAQTIVVVFAPGLGDDIQAIKAGIMEIADIFVVNKADRENADKTVMDIQANLQLGRKELPWKPPVVKTVAITGTGVHELIDKLEEHRCFLTQDEVCIRERQRTKAQSELYEAIREKAADSIIEQLRDEGRLEQLIHKILKKEIDPSSAAESLLKEKLKRNP